jgi:hypothetical protein
MKNFRTGVLVGSLSGLVFALSLWPAIAYYVIGWKLTGAFLMQSMIIGTLIGTILGGLAGPFLCIRLGGGIVEVGEDSESYVKWSCILLDRLLTVLAFCAPPFLCFMTSK